MPLSHTSFRYPIFLLREVPDKIRWMLGTCSATRAQCARCRSISTGVCSCTLKDMHRWYPADIGLKAWSRIMTVWNRVEWEQHTVKEGKCWKGRECLADPEEMVHVCPGCRALAGDWWSRTGGPRTECTWLVVTSEEDLTSLSFHPGSTLKLWWSYC